MNSFRTWQFIALLIWSSSFLGCSQQDEAATSESTATPQTNGSATVRDVSQPGESQPGELPATAASVKELEGQIESDPGVAGPNASEIASAFPIDRGASGADASVAQAGAVEIQPETSGTNQLVAPPTAMDLPIAVTASTTSVDAQEGAPQASTSPQSVPSGESKKPASDGTKYEPLFVDWPKPSVALMITGRQFGYMEPCGCSGLDNQNGGLVRRSTLLKQLRDKGWPVLPIDAGNQIRRFGRQAEIKFQITVQGLRTMGYEVISFGPDDLRLPAPELVGLIAPGGSEPSLFVSANVEVYDPSFTSQFRVFEKGGKKIGVTAVVGARNQKLIQNEDITLRSAEAGIKQVWPQLEQAKCDLYVLISHASLNESAALAKMFPQFKLVITTGGAGEPARRPDPVEGTETQMVQVGTKGMFAGVVALFDDQQNPLRYQRIPLDARFPDSQKMLQLLAEYQNQLKVAGFKGLGISEQPLPGKATFVGSEICDDCHGAEYKIWKEGVNGHAARHSHAYATLQRPPNARGGIPRNFDPECISCHVVGWNPQKYFPYKSGFLSLEKTPKLIDVGCENCHGPGSQHVAAENGDLAVDEDEIDAIREQMWLDLEDAEQKCLQCHDLDNSPAFQEEGAFERYWKKIAH